LGLAKPHFNAQIQFLGLAGVDDGHRTIGNYGGIFLGVFPCWLGALQGSPEEVRHLFQRTLGGGETYSLHPAFGDGLQPLQREGQVRPALGGHYRVDLVNDYCVHVAQAGSGVRGEQQI